MITCIATYYILSVLTCLTMGPSITVYTITIILVNLIITGAPILTWIAVALIDI